jgi:hypothetical protein
MGQSATDNYEPTQANNKEKLSGFLVVGFVLFWFWGF